MKLKYQIDPRIPGDYVEPLRAATEVFEAEAGDAAERITAEWGFRFTSHDQPFFQLKLRDSWGGECDRVFLPNEVSPSPFLNKEMRKLWGKLLWDTAAKQRQKVDSLMQKYLNEVEDGQNQL